MTPFAPRFPADFSRNTEVRHSRVALVSIGVALTIPLLFVADDLLQGLTDRLWSYGLAGLALVLLGGLVFRLRESGLWKGPLFWFLAAATPFAVLGPRTRFIEVLVLVGAGPLFFTFHGTKGGALRSACIFAEFLVLGAAAYAGLIPDWVSKYPWPLVPVLGATLVVVTALVMTATKLREDSRDRLAWLLRYDPDSGWPRKECLDEALAAGPRDRILVLVRWENLSELQRLIGPQVRSDVLGTIGSLASFNRAPYQFFHLQDNEFAILKARDPLGPPEIHGILSSLSPAGGQGPYRISVTLGWVDLEARPAGQALAAAQQALQTALVKRVPYWVCPVGREAEDLARHRLERHEVLCRAIEEGRLVTLFQPVVGALDLQPAWYEALLRIRHPDGTLESIFPYLPVASDLGLTPVLASAVLEKAAGFIQRWGLPVSVNLTLGDIEDPRLEASILHWARKLGPGKLILEVLERDPLGGNEAARAFVEHVRYAGGLVALDDFGSGYSTFGALASFDFDIVKIDGDLARRCPGDPQAEALARTLVRYCMLRGSRVVAEQAGHPETLAFFRSLGVAYVQGFAFGEPAPAPDLELAR